jgi:hypothetical protein
MTRLSILARAALLMLCATAATTATAAVSPDEAQKLKSTLTPLGADKAANKDGSIPAWDGGYTKVPAGWKNGDPRPDPFASEKPLVSISAKNMAEHESKLSDGVKAMMKRYPGFRIDVYPTHRTHAAPAWVYDNTFKNATSAKLVDNGYGVEGAYGGIPFPIPKDGFEAFQNSRLAWSGGAERYALNTWVITSDGKRTLSSAGTQTWLWPYYYKDGRDKFKNEIYKVGSFVKSAPSAVAGEALVFHEPITSATPRGIWQYLVGQRRIRKAPSVAYDTPDTVTSGTGLFDEAFGSFGPMDRHGYKLVGKQEMYIPYNANRAALASVDELVKPNHLNPDHVRWELHRVWVVEADLLPGKRHALPKRRYYLDEDSWGVVMADHWDAQGQLYHMFYQLPYLAPDVPAVVTGTVMWGVYNLLTGQYYYNCNWNGEKVHYPVPSVPKQLNEAMLSPETIATDAR